MGRSINSLGGAVKSLSGIGVTGLNDNQITVGEIEKILFKLCGEARNTDEDILVFGAAGEPVRAVQVCWTADLSAIKNAAEIGANLIVAHESLFYPYNITAAGGEPRYLTWHVNRERVKLLSANGISVIRMHGPMDAFCIFDDFAAQLDLGEPVINEPGFVKIYEIPPITYGELIGRVKKAVGMPVLRASNGLSDRVVTRVGLPWGGLGLFVNVGYVQKLLDRRCDVLIAGETDNYGARFAIDAGVDMIETGHEISENFGIRNFSEKLANEIAGLPVIFYENKTPFIFA